MKKKKLIRNSRTFQQKHNVSKNLTQEYLHQLEIRNLLLENAQTCKRMITETEILVALRRMPSNKSPKNDGIAKEFFEALWEDLKDPLTANK